MTDDLELSQTEKELNELFNSPQMVRVSINRRQVKWIISELHAARAALRERDRRIEELEADAKRLDWLEREDNIDGIVTLDVRDMPRYAPKDSRFERFHGGSAVLYAASLRTLIDAASLPEQSQTT